MDLSYLYKETARKKYFMLGNEAIVRGAIEAGVDVATTYPGTPTSEIGNLFFKIAKKAKVYFEFSTNESVAIGVAAAASNTGLKAMCFMKHVGLNVGADFLMSTAYIGTKGGLVILTGDDPSMHSSQNEQDNRNYAVLAHLPMIEPSTPQEAKDYIIRAFELSKAWELPIIFRTTTRVSHLRSVVELGKIKKDHQIGKFIKDPARFVPVPDNARKLRKKLQEKLRVVEQYVNISELNRIEDNESADMSAGFYTTSASLKKAKNEIITAPDTIRDKVELSSSPDTYKLQVVEELFNLRTSMTHRGTVLKTEKMIKTVKKHAVGVITSGAAYNIVKDVITEKALNIKILKLGITRPIPTQLILQFMANLKKVIIVEELDPYLEREIRVIAQMNGLKIEIDGKMNGYFPRMYEYNPDIVYTGLAKALNIPIKNSSTNIEKLSLPMRPPVLCPGCPHRSTYYATKLVLRQLRIDNAIITSDIGCYTLGIQKPYELADFLLAMGSSTSTASGFAKVTDQPVIAYIGDSTFFHNGIPGLINAIHNNAKMLLIVLDNRTTAMTGHQPHPGLPIDGMHNIAPELSIEAIVKALNVEFVKVVDPYDLKTTIKTIRAALQFPKLAVIIAKRECALLMDARHRKQGIWKTYTINQEKCTQCMNCVSQFSCPAIYTENNKVYINSALCDGCGVCSSVQVCPFRAIEVSSDENA